jgi:outer membrane protein assembly factor BamB
MGVGGDVIFGSNDGTLYAVRTRGSVSWCWAAPRPAYFYATPAMWLNGVNWHVLAGDLNGTLWEFNADTGALVGALDVGAGLASSPALALRGPPAAYVGTLQTGRLLKVPLGGYGASGWAFPAGGAVSSSPAVWIDGSGREVVVVGSENGTVWALEGASGGVVWAFPTGGAVVASPSLAALDYDGEDGDAVVFVGSLDGFMYALFARNGTVMWRYRTRGPVQGSAAAAVNCTGSAERHAPGALFFGSDDGYFYGLSMATGAPLWPPRFLQRGVVGAPAVSMVDTSCLVYVGGGDGALRAFNGSSGEWAWTVQVGDVVLSSPAIGPAGEVCVGTQDTLGLRGAVVCLEEGEPTGSVSASASPLPSRSALFTRTAAADGDTPTYTPTAPPSAAPSRTQSAPASAAPVSASTSSTASASPSPPLSTTLSPSRSAASPSPTRTAGGAGDGGGSASPFFSLSARATATASASPYDGGTLGSGPAAGAPWAQGGGGAGRSGDASGAPVRAAATLGAVFYADVDLPGLMWRAAVGGSVRGGAAVDGRGWVYVGVEGGGGAAGGAGGGVAVVEGTTGALLAFSPSTYGVRGVPARGGGEVFYAGVNGGFMSVALWGGRGAAPPLAPAPAPLWRFAQPDVSAQLAPAPAFAYASPLLVPGRGAVFAASMDASATTPHLFSLNASTGELLWALPRGGLEVASAPSASPDGGTLYVGTAGGGVAAVRADDGGGAWAGGDAALPPPPGSSGPLPVWAPVAVAPGGALLLACTARALWALHAANGALAWNFTPTALVAGATPDGLLPGAPSAAAPPPGAPGAPLPPFFAYWPAAGTLHALRGDTGALVWAYGAAAAGWVVAGAPAVAPGGATVFVVTTDGGLHGVAAATGARRWRWDAGQPLWAPPAVGINGWLFVGGAGGDLFAIGSLASASASPSASSSPSPSLSTTLSPSPSGGAGDGGGSASPFFSLSARATATASASPYASTSASSTVSGTHAATASASPASPYASTSASSTVSGTHSPSLSIGLSGSAAAIGYVSPVPSTFFARPNFIPVPTRYFSGGGDQGGSSSGSLALAAQLAVAAAVAAERERE